METPDKKPDASEDYALASSYSERIHQYIFTPAYDETRGAWRRMRKRIQLCRDCLKELDAPQSQITAGYSEKQILIARARVRIELVDLLFLEPDFDEGQKQSRMALEDAHAAKDSPAIHSALMASGLFYYLHDYLEDAVRYYQEAMVYSDAWYERYLVLFTMGNIYARKEETLPQAVFIFDWASQFGRKGFPAQIEKYHCLRRMGQRDALRAKVAEPWGDTCEEIASVLAALIVLRRQKKVLLRAARHGVETAKRLEHASWRRFFEDYTEKYTER